MAKRGRCDLKYYRRPQITFFFTSFIQSHTILTFIRMICLWSSNGDSYSTTDDLSCSLTNLKSILEMVARATLTNKFLFFQNATIFILTRSNDNPTRSVKVIDQVSYHISREKTNIKRKLRQTGVL